MKIVRNLKFREPVRIRTGDSILSGFDDGKVFVLGTVWRGELEPVIDSYLDAFEELVTPFTINPSSIPGALDLGKRWAGALRDKISQNVIRSRSGADPQPQPGFVNAAELVAASEELHKIMSSPMKTSFPISDVATALRRLRRASADITRTFPAPTRDSRSPHPMIAGYSRPHGAPSKPITPAMVNTAAADFWRERSGPTAPTRDAPAAKTPESINRMNAAFWAARAR
jgi:hypothetical protein